MHLNNLLIGGTSDTFLLNRDLVLARSIRREGHRVTETMSG